MDSIDLQVNRLIRVAFGPFQLGNLSAGEVEEVSEVSFAGKDDELVMKVG